jgi:hypothetical protein
LKREKASRKVLEAKIRLVEERKAPREVLETKTGLVEELKGV